MSIPGPQKILKTIGALWLSSGNDEQPIGISNSCPLSEVSCQAKFDGQDTCCFNYPGGQMLQTQFWDVDPAIGPDDAWTIHGLWPDHCDGGFDQYCDSKRKYSNISLILVDAGRSDLLDYMGQYWKDFRGDDANLWEHEWNKHGTCVSTLEPHCYDDYIPQQDVVDYFDKAVEVYKERNSYQFLADAGIVPSSRQTYAREDVENALAKGHGAPVTIRCRRGAFNEIWYHFNIAGSLQSGKFVTSDPDGPKSNCPAKVRYPLKRPQHDPSKTTTTHGSEPTDPGTPFAGRGNLMVSTLNQRRGCLISYGTWYTSGTCATFHADEKSDGTFTLRSSKGPCSFDEGSFTCGDDVHNPSQFTAKDEKLSFEGKTAFYADKAPKGWTQSKIYPDAEGHAIEIEITWRA
ncbi:hypothetical protein N7493_005310 [Penicillium malachiteum]|uniref:Ribonuclease T2-like n=1 Tax=Penicillium malachiteum TaxID=1324776 RepID=A0AAD6HMY4_9EURO|nr:hypothetical protein N7493_005310 [Penicillium malachiteum]